MSCPAPSDLLHDASDLLTQLIPYTQHPPHRAKAQAVYNSFWHDQNLILRQLHQLRCEGRQSGGLEEVEEKMRAVQGCMIRARRVLAKRAREEIVYMQVDEQGGARRIVSGMRGEMRLRPVCQSRRRGSVSAAA